MGGWGSAERCITRTVGWISAQNAKPGIPGFPAMDIALSMGTCGKPAMNTAMDIALSMGTCGKPAMNT
ncbi:MAG: hypothetical protein WC015_09375, partial [Methanoregula sp.]